MSGHFRRDIHISFAAHHSGGSAFGGFGHFGHFRTSSEVDASGLTGSVMPDVPTPLWSTHLSSTTNEVVKEHAEAFESSGDGRHSPAIYP
jgi:hypothetical protein